MTKFAICVPVGRKICSLCNYLVYNTVFLHLLCADSDKNPFFIIFC